MMLKSESSSSQIRKQENTLLAIHAVGSFLPPVSLYKVQLGKIT